MKSRKAKGLLSFLLVLVMAFGLWGGNVFAQDNEEWSVTISLEGLTLGQGLYVEPTTYTLSEINELAAEAGDYGPYTEDEVTAAIVTMAMFQDYGIEYQAGDLDSFYLSSVKDIDTGVVDIPEVIGENGGPDNEYNDGNDDEWLGSNDYFEYSGWMFTVDHTMPSVGANQYTVLSGDVIRWQFSTYMGADLGLELDEGWGLSQFFIAANKDALYRAYADLKEEGYFADHTEEQAAALAVMENLTASQTDVDAIQKTLSDAQEDNNDGSGDTGDGDTGTRLDPLQVLQEALTQLAADVKEPSFGTAAGEWSVLALARGGYYELGDAYFEDYYDRIVETVKTMADEEGKLDNRKSSENSRLILALSAIGKEAEDVGGVNLIAPFDDFDWIVNQGINGAVYALLALDSHDYQTTDLTIRQQCVDYLLEKQKENGGWALFGSSADPDMTAMALQALAPYREDAEVAEAVEKGVQALSDIQQDNGGFGSWGSINSESIAQVIIACTTLGINPDTDSRFVKADGSAVDALLLFYDQDAKDFSHVIGSQGNNMATDQALHALVSYQRLLNGENALFDMSDVSFGSGTGGTDGETNPPTQPDEGEDLPEQKPGTDTTPGNEDPGTETTDKDVTSLPETGDDPVILWLAAGGMVLAALGVAGLLVIRKRRNSR